METVNVESGKHRKIEGGNFQKVRRSRTVISRTWKNNGHCTVDSNKLSEEEK